MININSLEEQEIKKDIDKNKSILIIGEAATNNNINKITYYESEASVLDVYGESELLIAFKTAKNLGAKHIFLCNIKRKEDYIEVIEIVKQYDFAYVTPLNLLASDYFYDANRNGKKVYYSQFLTESITDINNTLFIFTDKHASLYESFDIFLDHYKNTVNSIKSGLSTKTDKTNLCVITNNIIGEKFSNVILAAELSKVNAGKYPKIKQYEILYDIDIFDIGFIELSYFKKHQDSQVTVENLLNFEESHKPEKVIVIDMIVKYIKRNLDLSYFSGQTFAAYQKLRVEKAIEDFLEPLVGDMIFKYKINNILMIKEQAGVGRIDAYIDIVPMNSIESFTVAIKG